MLFENCKRLDIPQVQYRSLKDLLVTGVTIAVISETVRSALSPLYTSPLLILAFLTASLPSQEQENKYRSVPLDALTYAQAESMVVANKFYDATWNIDSKGSKNKFELFEQQAGTAIVDYEAQLMWQQSGSPAQMMHVEAKAFVKRLNEKAHLGFTDWRLPTLEEAMSLVERKRSKSNLHIDPVFDSTQNYIWTADRNAPFWAWVVSFNFGAADEYDPEVIAFVRAVRTLSHSPRHDKNE